MPHQSVAIQSAPDERLTFVWPSNASTGHPLNLFWPVGSREGAIQCDAPPAEATAFYWVVAGLESSSAGLAAGSLVLLAQRIRATPGRGLGFRVLGTTLLVVENADDPPTAWRHRSANLTTCDTDATCETWSSGIFSADVGAADATGGGAECLGGVGCVYLVGSLGSAAAGEGQALMRAPLASLLAFDVTAFELLCSDGRWRPRPPGSGLPPPSSPLRPLSLFPQQPELTLHFASSLGKWIAGSFDGFGGKRLLLWSSAGADVRGPWSPTLAYTLPAPWSNTSRYYAYAVKLHPHLAHSADDMVITYVSNAWNMSDLFGVGEASNIYTPQVLRANLTALFRRRR